MKKLLYILSFVVLTPLLTGCFEEPGTSNLVTDLTDGFVEISEASGQGSTTKNIIVIPDGQSVTESITVSFGGAVSESAVDVTYEIDAEASTAVEGVDFSMISGSTVTIPAGEYTAPIEFAVEDDILDPDNPITVTFNITSSSVDILEEYSSVTITLAGLCPPDLFDYSTVGGDYNTLHSGESTDGCPSNNPVVDFASTVSLTPDPDNNTEEANAYIISDFHAGVYMEWYGDCYGYTFPTPARIFINTTTGNVTGSVEDAFGSTNEITSGILDACNGDVIYSWINGFGDTGEVTATQQ